MRRIVLSLLALTVLPTISRAAGDGVPPERLDRLARGINLSHWYAQSVVGHYGPEHVDTWTTRRDVQRVRDLGFTYVRLPFDPKLLWTVENAPDKLDPAFLARLEQAIAMILEADLAVMVDMHPDTAFSDRMREEPRFAAGFATFWRALATHLSNTDPERVFLEAVNEPVFNDAGRWWAVQKTVLDAMRAGAPRHTLVAGSDLWGRLQTLVEMTPYADRNIVYGFHCYDPFNFTHQGASWVGEPTQSLKRVPYPVTLEVAETIVPFQDNETNKGAVWQLGHERWNYPKLKGVLGRVADWGRKHNVPVACTEFGARRDDILPEHRFTYLRDFRAACEANGIPWAMWDYAGGFGIVTGPRPGERELDEMTVEALGLRLAPEADGGAPDAPESH
jgi:aryl-phospho-beta-D-glucosidase BglC (GH1 family)